MHRARAAKCKIIRENRHFSSTRKKILIAATERSLRADSPREPHEADFHAEKKF